ncbi:MAG: hypothetical protein GY909_18725 [Oligoflexia bacterium]|nr:hypothetical protein [Oligoflexia bacterium]
MENTSTAGEASLGLKEQIIFDLERKLDKFNDPKKGLRVMATGIGVHPKTLKRLLQGQNTPGYLTIYKIYRYLLNTTNDSKILEQVPSVIKNELIKGNPKDLTKGLTFSMDVEHEIASDKVFCEIYFLTDAGMITEELVRYRYGMHGLEILKKMHDLEVIKKNSYGAFEIGKNRANLSTQTMKKIGLHMIEKYFKPENCDELGNNHVGLYVAGLSEEGFNEWLKADKECFYKKAEIAKKHEDKNGIKGFTFMVTDTLVSPTSADEKWN